MPRSNTRYMPRNSAASAKSNQKLIPDADVTRNPERVSIPFGHYGIEMLNSRENDGVII